MKCSFCGYQFSEENAESACKGCFAAGGCKLIKCPRCGYEFPPEAKWLRRILKRREEDDTDRQGRRDT